MADNIELLLNAISPTATGVQYGTLILPTNGRRDFHVSLRMASSTGSASTDLMDFWIEESSEQTFATTRLIKLVPLVNPVTGATTEIFTQVTGNLTLPTATVNSGGATTTANTTLLRQDYEITINPNSWLRAGYRVQGTATSFTSVSLFLRSNSVP
jgi:hypothetical protein